MVYGIIELINFAHGDLFMLGSVFAADLPRRRGSARRVIAAGWLAARAHPARWRWRSARSINVVDRVARLPPAAQRAQARAADHRGRRQLHLPERRHHLERLGAATRGQRAAAAARHIGRASIRIKYLVVIADHRSAAAAADVDRAEDPAGQGDARDRAGSRRLALMGINVDRTISFTFALGGAMAGAAGTLYVQINGTTRYDAGFQLGLIAFTAAVLGGVGNLTGAVIGGLLIGVIQGLNDSAPTASSRSEVVADGGVQHPDPDDGVPARGHLSANTSGEGVAMAAVTCAVRLAVGAGLYFHAAPRARLRQAASRRIAARHCGLRAAAPWSHQRSTGRASSPLAHRSCSMCLIFVIFALGPEHRRRLRRPARPRLRRLLPLRRYTAAWLMSTSPFKSSRRTSTCTCSAPPSQLPASTSRSGSCCSSPGWSAAIAGIIIGAPTLRLKSDYLALVTLGFGEIIPQVFRNGDNISGFNLTNGTKGIGPIDADRHGLPDVLPGVPKTIVSVRLPTQRTTSSSARSAALLRVRLAAAPRRTLGRAWLAIREDELRPA